MMLYFVSENISRFLVTRDLIIAVYRARGKMEFSRCTITAGPRIYQKNEFAQGAAQFTGWQVGGIKDVANKILPRL